jgi:hypothetical protein
MRALIAVSRIGDASTREARRRADRCLDPVVLTAHAVIASDASSRDGRKEFGGHPRPGQMTATRVGTPAYGVGTASASAPV